MLLGKVAAGGPNKLKAGSKITKAYIEELPREQWFEIRLKNEEANSQLETAAERLKAQRDEFDRRYEEKKREDHRRRRPGAGRAQDGQGLPGRKTPYSAG